MSRKALGRGLNALLGEPSLAAPQGAALEQIDVRLIDPNPFQPRRAIAPEQLKQLAASIQASGVVQPVLLRASGDRYQLVAGERRWRAAILAKLETVPAVVKEISDREALEMAIAENLLREDLTPIEVARAYQAMQESFGHSHEEIALRLGLDRSTVTNTLRLLRLPEDIQNLIHNKELSAGHARAMLACSSADQQAELARRIKSEGLSVRQAESLAAATHSKASKPATRPADPNVRSAVLEMERALGTRVRIVGDDNRGRIEISYYSSEDLNRLHNRLTQA